MAAPGLCLAALSALVTSTAASVAGPRRRTIVALVALPLTVGVFGALGRVFSGAPDFTAVGEVATWLSAVAVDQWEQLLAAIAAAMATAWLSLWLLARLSPTVRQRAPAALLALLGAIALWQSWARPAEPGTSGIYEGVYAQSQFEALGPGALLAALGLLLALASLWRTRPR